MIYYIYTLEATNGVYVGCTVNPLRRWANHLNPLSNLTSSKQLVKPTFYLRYQTTDQNEARAIEERLINKLEAINYMKRPSKHSNIKQQLTRQLYTSIKRPRQPTKAKIKTYSNGKYGVYHNRHWIPFTDHQEAEDYITLHNLYRYIN